MVFWISIIWIRCFGFDQEFIKDTKSKHRNKKLSNMLTFIENHKIESKRSSIKTTKSKHRKPLNRKCIIDSKTSKAELLNKDLIEIIGYRYEEICNIETI